MSHGFRTSSTERAAVQKFVRRSATIWGVPDSSTPIGRFEPSEEPILEDETLSSETAQLAIDLLRSEAAADDQMSHSNYRENQYLQATEAALEKIHGGIECGYLVPPLNLIEAQRVIHAFPEIEPDIAEILKKLSSNFQVRKSKTMNENNGMSTLFRIAFNCGQKFMEFYEFFLIF